MSGINKVIAIGNLGQDPETRYTQGGSPVTNFSIAVSEKWKDKQSGETREETEWINCTAFGRLAEVCSQYLRKGSKVYIEGKMKTSSWEKDGQKHYRTGVNVREMQMLGGQPSSQGDRAVDNPLPTPDDFDDDSIPF